MQKINESVQKKHVFSIKGFNGVDTVKHKALGQELLVKSDYPIEYKTESIELGLVEFFDESIGYTYADVVINRAKRKSCNTTSMLASILLANQDQIPESWNHNLVFPGTLWTSPCGHRGLTILSKKKKVWVAALVGIDSFPSFTNCRFVYDCRDIEFPKKEQVIK